MRPWIHALRLAVLLSAAAAAVLSFEPPLRAARPLANQVLIRRDTFGIPHIFGETDEAAAFGLGFAQAEDHLEQLARRIIQARGESARYFGESGIESDFAMRRLDNLAEARRHLGDLGTRYRQVIRAFAQGINHYVEQHRSETPPWVPVFDEADILANSRVSAVQAVASPALFSRLREKYPGGDVPGAPAGRGGGQDLPVADDEGPDEPGSNALAIGPSRSASGHPILLANPHLRWSSLYWEAHVIVPRSLNFYGSTLVGIPWLRAGFNDRLGYVQTNNAPDLADVYALQRDPRDAARYLFDGRSRPIVQTDVAVEVQTADGAIQKEHRTYWSTHLGPVVYRTNEAVFAYRSVSLDAWRFYEGFYELSHARRLKDYVKTLSRRLITTSNFTYADADGNILYQWNAKLPKRRDDGTNYELDVPAPNDEHVWRTYHETAALPRLLNPRGGYIQNANNPPWFVSLRDPIDQARYPSYVERGELALRPQMALRMLDGGERFTPDAVLAIKFTPRMLLAERVKPALLDAARAVSHPPADLSRGIELLAAWDDQVAAASIGALVFQHFWDTYRVAVKQPYAVPWDPKRPAETPSGLGDPAAAVPMLEEAVRWVRSTFGSESAAWGSVHRYRFGDIDLPGEGAEALYGAYRVQQFDNAPGGKYVAGWIDGQDEIAGFGDAWILLVHFTNPVQAQSVLAYGETSRRGAPHGRDQIGIFARRALRPVWFTEAEIRAHLEREYRP